MVGWETGNGTGTGSSGLDPAADDAQKADRERCPVGEGEAMSDALRL